VRLLALVVIAGCGRIDFDIGAQGDADSGDPPCLVDTFDTLDPTRWRETDPATSIVVAVANGRLEITPAPLVNEYNSVASIEPIDFVDAAFEVEVLQVTDPPMSETAIEIEYTAQTRFIISVDTDQLQYLESNTTNQLRRPYDPVTDRFWRVRHEAAAAQIRFQTSADRLQWSNDYTIATPLTGSVTFYFYAGQFQGGNASPGTAAFDNFRIVRAGCS
jgi:hypothetical protein